MIYTFFRAIQAIAERVLCVRKFFGNEGSLFRSDPSPRLGLGIFNGRRPVRESQKGNGAERHPFPVSSTVPHYRRTKSESQEHFPWVMGQFPITAVHSMGRCNTRPKPTYRECRG